MEKYTVFISLAGILGLIGLVAALTFMEDGKKWLRFRFLKLKRKRINQQRTSSLRDKNQIFLDKEDTLFGKQLQESEKYPSASLSEQKMAEESPA